MSRRRSATTVSLGYLLVSTCVQRERERETVKSETRWGESLLTVWSCNLRWKEEDVKYEGIKRGSTHLLQLFPCHVAHLQLGPVFIQQNCVRVLGLVPAAATVIHPVIHTGITYRTVIISSWLTTSDVFQNIKSNSHSAIGCLGDGVMKLPLTLSVFAPVVQNRNQLHWLRMSVCKVAINGS